MVPPKPLLILIEKIRNYNRLLRLRARPRCALMHSALLESLRVIRVVEHRISGSLVPSFSQIALRKMKVRGFKEDWQYSESLV